MRDYQTAFLTLKKNPNNKAAQANMDEVVAFFNSRWYRCLTDIPGDVLMDMVERKKRVHTNSRKTRKVTTMTINEYQKLAMRTANKDTCHHLLNGVLGLCGESGEVADLVKKATFQGHELNHEHVAKELGDIAWYLALSATAIGYDLETVMQMNIDKLRKRYPEGFDAKRSLYREEGDI